jgi:hypothetical protein
VGDEIIEVRWGGDTFGQPVLSERPSMIIVDDARVVVFGALPDNATSVDAVAPDGERVACTIGEGVWLVVLPNNHRGGELYPVLFRDQLGEPVNPGLPASWQREAIGKREQRCPAWGLTRGTYSRRPGRAKGRCATPVGVTVSAPVKRSCAAYADTSESSVNG